VVYNRPYRRHYYPVRYHYYGTFYNNYRPTTSIGVRQGHNVYRNSSYATANRSSRNITTITSNANSRRSLAQNNNTKKISPQSNRQHTNMGRNISATANPFNTVKRIEKKALAASSKTPNTHIKRDYRVTTSNSSDNNNYKKRALNSKSQGINTQAARQRVNHTNKGFIRTNNTGTVEKSGYTNKPNSTKPRTYNINETKTRHTQVAKHTVNKPETILKSKVSRTMESNKTRVSQNRSSSDMNIKSNFRSRL
jgi:hypothetical protein